MIVIYQGDYEFSHKPCTEIDQRKCVPCSVRLPSCRNLRDGTHPHPTIPNKYLICKMERTLRVMTCLKGVFDEALRQCREVADSSEYKCSSLYLEIIYYKIYRERGRTSSKLYFI